MAGKWTRKEIEARAEAMGLRVILGRPGDGVTRYWFERIEDGTGNPIGRELGLARAGAWLDGYIAAKQ